jgi:uncharacterized repeat protein (TIGR01451 family)
MCRFYITIVLSLLFTKKITSQSIYNQNGTAYNIEYKDDKITIFFNDNFQCSNIGPGGCYGITSNSTQYQMSGPFYLPNNYLIPSISGVYKTNNIEMVRGFSSSTDSSLNPYICVTADTITDCFFDNGMPTLGSSYCDNNNFIHYVGYVGSKIGICAELPAHRFRYIKTNTLLTNTDGFTTYYTPDSLLQYYDIELYNPNINRYEYGFNGFQTLILPTNDNQSLIIYSSPEKDTIYNFFHKNSFSILKLDDDLNKTYSINAFSGYYSDSAYLEYSITKSKKINNKIYIEGDAVKSVNTIRDSTYTFLLELDSNGILLNEILKPNEWYHYNFIDSMENLNRDFEVFSTDSTTTINYYNAQRDTIKTITFPEKLNHNFVKTNDNKFLFVNYHETEYGYEAYLNIYDEHARKLKKDIIVSSFWIDNGYITNAFLGVDSFQNVMFFYHLPTGAGGMACGSTYQQIKIGFQNLDNMNFISGKITNDIIQNCSKDTLEPPVKNILVEMQLNSKVFFTNSDEAGNYRFTPHDTGHAKIILHLSNQSIFTDACQDTFHVVLSDTLENPVVNFLLQTPVCNHPIPKVTVDITTPFLRRCFDNIYTITLMNESSDTAFNTYADIELDNYLIAVDTAFLSAQYLGNNTYRFNFGTLHPLQTIRKNLTLKVSCDSTVLGQTHCVKATSYPYENCNIANAKYMQALAYCRNDSVIISVINIGYPEIFQQAYRVIADDSIVETGTLSFTPTFSFANLSFYNPAGKTYRLETRQYPMFIGEDSTLSVGIEGCGNSNYSTGYITQFQQDDDAPNVSVDCHQNVGSYDPNDKSAHPVGYGNSHLIESQQTVEYTIHFQNLGTYAADIVTILDTLSSDFDITTFKTMGSSHNFTVSIIDSNILKFSFSNINLIDAATDSLLSNGFIKFSIQAKPNTIIGSEIKNNAYITFDYNEAIKTNLVQHEIGKDFLKSSIISLTKNNLFKDVSLKIYPNPSSRQFTVEIIKVVPENASLHIYTLDGNEIYVQHQLKLINRIKTENWSKGFYLFELRSNNTLLQSGKIIIE